MFSDVLSQIGNPLFRKDEDLFVVGSGASSITDLLEQNHEKEPPGCRIPSRILDFQSLPVIDRVETATKALPWQRYLGDGCFCPKCIFPEVID